MARKIKIKVPALNEETSGIISIPSKAKTLLLLAHGAGAGMEHPFMNALADELAESNIATLRFNFLYMHKGGKRPDSPRIAHAALVAAKDRAVAYAKKYKLKLIAGGKSFGGRMTSQAAAAGLLPEVERLVFFGFPLHATGRPGIERADHLKEIKQRMLFLQGTRDTLAQNDLIKKVCNARSKAKLIVMDGADHSFKMLKSSGKTQEDMIRQLAAQVSMWI